MDRVGSCGGDGGDKWSAGYGGELRLAVKLIGEYIGVEIV